MKRIASLPACLLLLACPYLHGQADSYQYRRELKGISGQWHKITLPDDIFGKASDNLNDIRIWGITPAHDTVEAPYLLRLATGKTTGSDVPFKVLNTSYTDKGYFFTFEVPTAEPVDQIRLDFKERNFDRRVKLEGSHNQDEWFTIADDYRIMSIKNPLTDFQFTRVSFPPAKYRFFRLHIAGKDKPGLVSASVSQNEKTGGAFRSYSFSKPVIKENRQSRQTEIDIRLESPVPVSYVEVSVKDTFDYYRPATVQYLADSFRTERGWQYRYQTLTTGILSSEKKNELIFAGTANIQKMRILIHNQNNLPLTIDSIRVKGYVHDLVARFTEKGDYFLVYGNKNAGKPYYDIGHFENKIPASLTSLTLGEEQLIADKEQVTGPLFQNKAWLWGVMGVIILLLGWFSLKMMRS